MPSKYLRKLAGKRVLIFGATSGIGFAVAEALLDHEAVIVIAGSNQDRLESAVRQLQSLDGGDHDVESHVIDLSKIDALEEAFPNLLAAASDNGNKPLDHIVYTAGDDAGIFADLKNASLATIQGALIVRTLAPALLGRAIMTTGFRYFKKSASSSMTFTGGAGTTKAVLSMIGHGLEGLAEGLAVELAPIRVNVVHPGMTMTEKMRKRLPEAAIKAATAATLTSRVAEPEDLAEAYLYSMKNPSVTGQALKNDNGKTVTR